MAGEKSKAVTHTTLIPRKEAEEIFKEFSKIPMAGALIETFKFAAGPLPFRKKKGCGGCEIYAEIGEQSVGASMVLRQVYKRVDLIFYDGPIGEIPASGWINAFCGEFASITAGPKNAGVWAYGRGDLMTYGISVYIHRPILLPSNFGRWFLNLMKRFALIATEFHLDVSDQPRFWDGDKEEPE